MGKVEEKFQLMDGLALARIYHVERASLLFANRGGSAPPKREGAFIGVIAALARQKKRLLYAVGQFDMPSHGGPCAIGTERGRKKLAQEHLRNPHELSSSLRPQ